MQLRERAFAASEVVLNYAEGPSTGPPFVLLHGGSGRWQYGLAFLELLASAWHVFALDFRGHGKSGRAQSGYRLADYVRDTAEFLGDVIGEPATVYGHSLGGEAAVSLAAAHPQLFRALI